MVRLDAHELVCTGNYVKYKKQREIQKATVWLGAHNWCARVARCSLEGTCLHDGIC
jgi:hypothetical protein